MKDINAEDVELFIRMIQFMTPRQKNFFLQTLNKEQMRIFEIACFNLAVNPQGLSAVDGKLLSKYKRQIEAIANKHVTLTDKRRVAQTGGFISAVLPVLATLLASFLTK